MVSRGAGDLAFYERVLRGIKRQIREVQGPEDEEVKRYYRAYASEIERASPAESGPEEFLEAAAGAPAVLVGDFHTLDQAQKQFLRVLQDLCGAGANPVVALEMVHAAHDRGLQRYLSRQSDEETLLDDIDFFDNWGFDFAHYRPILSYLRESGVEARGINREGTLRARDRHMAGQILALRRKYRDRPVLALVGDLHLARAHLPGDLRRGGVEPVVLFQNSETVAMRNFRRGAHRRELSPEGEAWWKLGQGRFLVNNTVPWVKMMTYLTWLEHGGEALCSMYGYCRYDEDEGGDVDLTETLHAYIRVLKEFFSLGLRGDDDFQVFTLNDVSFLKNAYFRHEPGRTYRHLIQAGRPLFLTWENTIYIPMLDVNRTAQEAAHYLMGRTLNVEQGRVAFHDRIHYFASGFVASKLINPVRREDTKDAMRQFIARYEAAKRPKERKYLAPKYEACRLALDYLERLEGGEPFPAPYVHEILERDRAGDFTLSEMVGRYMGGSLFRRYNRGELSGVDLKQYIFNQHNPLLFHEAED